MVGLGGTQKKTWQLTNQNGGFNGINNVDICRYNGDMKSKVVVKIRLPPFDYQCLSVSQVFGASHASPWFPCCNCFCGWEICTEYHCNPTKVFLKFFTVVETSSDCCNLAQGSRLKPFNWLKGQSNQLAQFTEPNSGVKRCSSICLLVGTSGTGLGCSLTLETRGL